MSKKKKPFEYSLPERVTHEEHQKEVKIRSILDKTVGAFLFVSGFLAVLSILVVLLTASFGEYTGRAETDLIIFLFILGTGLFSLYQGYFLWSRFLCRFCIAAIPEGSTYCPICEEDLLSNRNPQSNNSESY